MVITRIIVAALAFFAIPLLALQVEPWYGEIYQPGFRATYRFQYYNHFSGKNGISLPLEGRDQFLTLGGDIALTEWRLEIEATVGHTPSRAFYFDSVVLQGSYLWFDDVAGDPFTLLVGANGVACSKAALDQPALFHHALVEGEAFLSLGKEFSRHEIWQVRAMAYFGVGIGFCPWLHSIVALEKNFCDRHQWRLDAEWSKGLGHGQLTNIGSFHGYGPLNYQSVDVGLGYTYLFPYSGNLSVEYRRRVEAKECPQNANILLLTWFYPFSL